MKHVGEYRVQSQRAGDAGACRSELLGHYRQIEQSPPAAAELARDGHVDEAQFARLVEHVHRKARLAVALRRDRLDLPARKLACGVLNQLLLFGELEVHRVVFLERIKPFDAKAKRRKGKQEQIKSRVQNLHDVQDTAPRYSYVVCLPLRLVFAPLRRRFESSSILRPLPLAI